jgi:hypothetical protein
MSKNKKKPIKIKEENRGIFTKKAKAAGMSVQAYANKILSAKEGKYSPELRMQANFARNAATWKKELGGSLYDALYDMQVQQMELGGQIGAGLAGATKGVAGSLLPGQLGSAAMQAIDSVHRAADNDISKEEAAISGYGQAAGALGTAIATGGATTPQSIAVGAQGLGQGLSNTDIEGIDTRAAGDMISTSGQLASLAMAQNPNATKMEMGGDLTKYTGNTHEEGGIPIEIEDKKSKTKKLIEVEGGETKYGDYVYSNTLKIPGTNETYAYRSQLADKKFPRKGDIYDMKGKHEYLSKLMNMQENHREKLMAEYNARVGEVNSDFEDQMKQVMACGGHVKKYMYGGKVYAQDGLVDDSKYVTKRMAKQGITEMPEEMSTDFDPDMYWRSRYGDAPFTGEMTEAPVKRFDSFSGGNNAFANPNPNQQTQPGATIPNQSGATGQQPSGFGFQPSPFTQGNITSNNALSRFNLSNNIPPSKDAITNLANVDATSPSTPMGTSTDIPAEASYVNAPRTGVDFGKLGTFALQNMGNIYNVTQGLQKGDPIEFTDIDPNLVNYDRSRQAVNQAAAQAYNTAAAQIGASTTSSGQRLSALAALNASLANKKMQALSQIDEKEAIANAGIRSQADLTNLRTDMETERLNAMTEGLRQQTLQQGLLGLGESASKQIREDKLYAAQDRAISQLGTDDYLYMKDADGNFVPYSKRTGRPV